MAEKVATKWLQDRGGGGPSIPDPEILGPITPLEKFSAMGENRLEWEFFGLERPTLDPRPRRRLDRGMKPTLLSLAIALLMVGCGGVLVDYSKLQNRNGVTYLPNEETPFTGRAERLYENGQKRIERNYKDGKRDGLYSSWYENGQKMSEVKHKDGKADGLETVWYENGQWRRSGNHVDGKMDGVWTHWYENGQQRDELFYLGGYIVSAIVWKPDGEKCSMTDVKAGNGMVVKYMDDGTDWLRISYKDGEKHGYRLTYKDGERVMGLTP